MPNNIFKTLTGGSTKSKRKYPKAKRTMAELHVFAETLNCEIYPMGTFKAWGIIDKTTRNTPTSLDSSDCYYNVKSIEEALETVEKYNKK